MNFTPVSISDYAVLKPFFSSHPYRLSVYSPASIIAWSYKAFKADYAIEEGQLFIAGQTEDRQDDRHLILPLSKDKSYSPSELYDIARRAGFNRYWYVPGDYLQGMACPEWEGMFVIDEQKGFGDYIYLTEDLINLRGNRFSKKRNLIHQFSREYILKKRVTVEDILPGSVEECLQFLEIWCAQHQCDADQENNLTCEKNAAITTLRNMSILESNGILIRVDGRVSAFGIGSRLSKTTAALNFEKADPEIKGLYQFLDNECAKRLFSGFLYVNKESDMNIPSLAESKHSYNPILYLKSYSLTLR